MKSAKSTGRRIGILVLLHLATGLTTPYIMLQSLQSPLTFEANSAANSFKVRLSVMLLFVGGALAVAIAITALPIFRRYSYTIAVWILAVAIVNLSLQGAENAAYMSLFTFSREYLNATPADAAVYTVVGMAVRSVWKWVHYTHLLILVSWMFMLSIALWRSILVPRALAGLLLITSLLQITGITLPQFLAYPSPNPMLMGMPLGFVYLALSLWLIGKGFRATPQEATDGEKAELADRQETVG